MMTAKEKLQRASASVAFDGIFKYIKKKPQENLLKLIDISQKFMGGAFPEKNFDAFRKAVKDESNVWNHFAMNIINECDPRSRPRRGGQRHQGSKSKQREIQVQHPVHHPL